MSYHGILTKNKVFMPILPYHDKKRMYIIRVPGFYGRNRKPEQGDAVMGILESLVKNVFCDVVKPRIGSVVKVDLLLGADHTGIYVGNDEIVELANVDGVALVRIVSAREFIDGVDGISRIGAFIYVACKQDRNGNCVAMGSKDIADRAMAAVGHTSSYDLIYNNCHMFTEHCVSGKKREDLSGLLWGVELALDKKFIKHDYERLLDMWRSTGQSLGPC